MESGNPISHEFLDELLKTPMQTNPYSSSKKLLGDGERAAIIALLLPAICDRWTRAQIGGNSEAK